MSIGIAIGAKTLLLLCWDMGGVVSWSVGGAAVRQAAVHITHQAILRYSYELCASRGRSDVESMHDDDPSRTDYCTDYC